MRKIAAVLLVIVSVLLAEEWSVLMQFRKAEGNLTFATANAPGKPALSFRISGAKRSAVISIADGKWNIACQDDKGSAISLPEAVNYPAVVQAKEYSYMLKFREEWWAYYINGVLCGEMQAPMKLEGCKLEWPNSVQISFTKQLDFQITSRPSYQTDFMIEPGAKDELQPWKREYGNWHIHTALLESIIRPETNQDTMKRTPPSADKSPNFYSLKGSGKREESLITTGSELYDNYSLTASMQPEAGEVGIVFLCRGEGKSASFYALTLYRDNGGEVRLWKQENGARTMLARVAVPLYNKQWYLPGVSLRNGEIIATLDKALLFRYRAQLPASGRIGLYACTPEETRFDDVTLSPYGDISLESAADIAANMLFCTSGISIPNEERASILLPHAAYKLSLSAGAEQNEMLVLGRAHEKSMLFSAQVTGNGGLVAGWHGKDAPYYLFKRTKSGRRSKLELIRHAPGGKSVVDSFSIPWRDAVELLVEIDEKGTLRCCCDDALIFRRDEVSSGAAGLFVVANDEAQFSRMELMRQRRRVHELKQKNVVFEHDPFMRHWSAAEGQWISGGGDILYHKGDFFSDFTLFLPYRQNGELHLGVADGATEGALKLLLTNQGIRMIGPDDFDQTFAIEAPKPDRLFSLQLEGYWLDLLYDGKVLFSRRLEMPLREYGTRVLTKKYTVNDMTKSKVVRYNVIDEFFNESPHDWSVNGGDWQIINRFQCTASWSHMISQSLETMGAFWRKQRFSGDMVLEFYAGTRHGYYYKAGNMNCTIMAKDNTASSGYTATCSEWDQNNSQNWTYLYRNGVRLNRSDAYMIPRQRTGQYRRILNPLIARGRDIHGAWYYIKLRKIGTKLEYWFDDELVMTSNDPDVLNEGTLGIWTFDHSMTLAQIKITYEKAEAKQHKVTLLPNELPAPKEPPAEEHWESTVNGFPLNPMEGRYWEHRDTIGQSNRSTFAANTDGILLVNSLGAGKMMLNAKLPPLCLAETAGFRFQVKRTASAQFNFFYYIGEHDGKGALVRSQNYYHRITGDDFSDGAWKKTGESQVPATDCNVHDKDGWTTVTVWLPRWLRRTAAEDAKRFIHIGGFGLEQLDFLVSGIGGNTPDDAYAVWDFHPIFYRQPTVALEKESHANARAALNGRRNAMTSSAEELSRQMSQCQADEQVVTAFIDLKKEGSSSAMTAKVAWLKMPERPVVSLEWSKLHQDAIAIRCNVPYADYRLEKMNLLLNGEKLKIIAAREEGGVIGWASIPRTQTFKDICCNGKMVCELRVSESDIRNASFDMADKARRNGPPALMKLQGFSPMWLGFEENDMPTAPLVPNPRLSIKGSDAQQGRYLQVKNSAGQGGLVNEYKVKYSVAEYPLFYFRYNADDMCNASLIYPGGNAIRLAEQSGRHSRNVRLAVPFVQDGGWHSWLGFVADAFTNRPYQRERHLPANFRIGTVGGHDQTGRYSTLKLDDIVLCPAVNAFEKLSIQPEYFDLDGIERLEYATFNKGNLYNGEEPQRWIAVAVNETIHPKMDAGVNDGVVHILLRAVDKFGNISPVTDLPFLLDRRAPAVNASIINWDNPTFNGKALRLDVGIANGAPWAIEKAGYSIQDKEVKINQWSHEYERNAEHEIVYFNYPFILRKWLDASSNGDTLQLKVSGVQDGAGNAAPDSLIPIAVKYEDDKRGPNWLSLDCAKEYPFMVNWDGRACHRQVFSTGNSQEAKVETKIGGSPYLIQYTHYGSGELRTNVKWKLDDAPYIAFRLSTTTYRQSLRLRLVMTTENNINYIISLTAPSKDANELNTSRTFQWKNGEWQNFIFNVKKMLQDKGVKNLESLSFKSIGFYRSGTNHRDTLLLDDLFIFGPSKKKSTFTLVAFDVSGVASIDAYEGDSLLKSMPVSNDKYSFEELRTEKPRWLKLIAKDKAGNLSAPCWLPLAPK